MMFLLSVTLGALAADSAGTVEDNKETAETFVRNLAKIRSDDISYSYISIGMLKQMFSRMIGAEQDIKDMFASLRYLRQFASTGKDGYDKLREALSPFLVEDDLVMGMELMALNRDGSTLSVVYSASDNILVITDDGGDELKVVFIAGMSYRDFRDNDGNIGISF